MKLVDKGLPDNVEALTDLVLHLKDKLSHQSDYIKQLIEAIQLARHQHVGTRSEKFNIGQLSLLFNETEGLLDHEDDKQANEDVGNDETTTVGPFRSIFKYDYPAHNSPSYLFII